jgi:dolichyl-phosphate-mannose-protein mannosyltransferase
MKAQWFLQGGLVLALALGAWLRFAGLTWGVPRFDPELAAGTESRNSYHPDEHKILWELEAMRPRRLDLHPTLWGWGTLSTYTTGLALLAGRTVGAVPRDWRSALREGRDLPRLYVAGRTVSALLALLTLPVVFSMGRALGGPEAGAWAAGLLAVSPLHVVNAHFLTPDAALAFWMAVAGWALVRGWPMLAGFSAGLALATKPTAAFLLPLFAIVHVRHRPKGFWRAYPCLVAGFVLGEPYAVIDPRQWISSLGYFLSHNTTGLGPVGPATILGRHLLDLALYGLGPIALAMALFGLVRGRSLLLGAACGLLFTSLLLTWVPLARYELPLLPFLAVAAGLGLRALLAPTRALVGVLALLPPAAVSMAQVDLLRDTHTAQQAADWIGERVGAGSSVALLWHQYPVLDGRRWRLELFDDPFALEGHAYRPLFAERVVLDGMPIVPFRPELQADLDAHYVPEATFTRRPRLLGVSLPEPLAPHDWRYTHPEMRILRRR